METRVYHIIFDCDFGKRHNLSSNTDMIIGNIRNVESDIGTGKHRIPVLFELGDAEEISKRMVYLAKTNGCVGNKKYPVFGTVLLEIKLNSNVSVQEVNIIDGNGKKDYTKIINSSADIVTYVPSGRSATASKSKKRGMLSVDVLKNATVTPIKYISNITDSSITEHVGFSLLNLNPALTKEDICELRKLYKNILSGPNTSNDNKLEESSALVVPALVPTPDVSVAMDGGDDEKYFKLYQQEKTRYLQLKAIRDKMKTK